MATQAKRDYYELLTVQRDATQQEIRSAFQKLEGEFRSSGKPKSIDDVEWLRQLRRAYDVLSDGDRRRRYDRSGDEGNFATEPTRGYDFAAIAQISRSVDAEIKARRIRWMVWEFLSFLGLR